MPPAIDPSIRKQVITQYLNGVGRNQIARDLHIGQGTVTGIIETLKQGGEGLDPDYQAIRDLAIHCREEGFGSIENYRQALRIKNYLARLGPNIKEETIETFIASLVNSSNPSKLIEAATQISESGIPLEKLEEHVRVLKAQKETLQREIDEGRVILDGVHVDAEGRRQLMEEYAQMKAEMRRCGIGAEDPRKIQACFQRLKDANYNAEEVIAGYANMEALRKERMDLDEERLAFEAKLATVKDVLPLAEQITQLKVGIGELLTYEKADMEKIPLDTAAIVENIQHYSQLGGLKKEMDRLLQKMYIFNAYMTSRQQAFASLIRLQALGVTDTEIKNMVQLIENQHFIYRSNTENNNGNTNNGWSTF